MQPKGFAEEERKAIETWIQSNLGDIIMHRKKSKLDVDMSSFYTKSEDDFFVENPTRLSRMSKWKGDDKF